MEWLFTPWRMKYILDEKRKRGQGCVFCEALATRRDRKTYILHRGRTCFVILNIFPYTTGHLLLAPNRHAAKLADLTDDESAELMDLIRRCERLLAETYRPDGLNVGANIGRPSGAGIPGHLHLHIVPRWTGDANFMPVIGGTRIVPQSLDETWRRLRPRAARWGGARRVRRRS